jgi:hypothetical protein
VSSDDLQAGRCSSAGFWDPAWDWITKQREPTWDMGAESDEGQVYGG